MGGLREERFGGIGRGEEGRARVGEETAVDWNQ